jgi:DNA-binding FadR family transcriptional regulator
VPRFKEVWMSAVARSSAVRRVARALRDEVLKCEDGQLIGSEEDLVERYHVSRPTLRQAVALVAEEQLLTVKRGVGGGYFARRPDSRAVVHMTAIYLHSRAARVEEIIRALEPVRVELACLAVRNRDPKMLKLLREFLDREKELEKGELQYRTFLKGEREFGELLGVMGRNKVLALFLEILYDLAAQIDRADDLYVNRPARVAEYRSKRNRLAEAILEGDEEMAVFSAKRLAANATEWMMEDLKRAEAGQTLLNIREPFAFGDLDGASSAFEPSNDALKVSGAQGRRPRKTVRPR